MEKLSQFPKRKKHSLLSGTRICGALLASLIATASFGQGVGINTTNPDPSAALDIQSSNKGILIPKVSLQNSIDNTTVPNPANGLLVYNTNPDVMLGVGFYYNAATPPATPSWTSLSELKLPISKSGNTSGTALSIGNYNNSSSNNVAISATSPIGYALKTDGKVQITGSGQVPGFGKVLSSDASGNATWEGGIAFSVIGLKTGGPEVLAKNTLYRVPFDVDKYDTHNAYAQYPESAFTAPTGGIYHFDVKVSFFTSEAGRVQIRKLNGGAESVLISADVIGGYQESIDFRLAAGDVIFVTIIHSNDDNLSLITGDSHFNGHFVQKIF